MKSQDPVEQKTTKPLQWQVIALPVGLRAAMIKDSTQGLELTLPATGEKGFTLSVINYKGDLRIQSPGQMEQPASPGLCLLSRMERP